MYDRAIDMIQNGLIQNINFNWLRSNLMADLNLRDSLDKGHAVLETPNQLDQYLYTYGPMISSQWRSVSNLLSALTQPTTLVDYGCGQGLGGLIVNDVTRGKLFQLVERVFLIEPSSIALRRAEELYKRIIPGAKVYAICKDFESVTDSDVKDDAEGMTLHLFSNSLDLPRQNYFDLFDKTIKIGNHSLISVSHDRDFNGGTPQIEEIKARFEHPDMAEKVLISNTVVSRFTCDNPGQSLGFVWLCEFEVRDG